MQNYFFFSSHVLLLFKEWQIDSVGVLVGAFVGLFLFTFLYEIASFYQSRYANGGAINSTRSDQTRCNESEEPYSYGTFRSGHPRTVPSSEDTENIIPLHVRVKLALTSRYIWSSLSFPFMVAANYFIMLAVMTYNAWLLIAVCLASGLGYFLLRADNDIPPVKPQNDGTTTPLLSSDEKLVLHA
ncbi:high affinity copper uptake 1 isoform X1 [Paramuricea clavata]|uniref:Copper transport protein n=1 Tax=Paramuricea clavata TaxID=317549 RepID=A0A6S7I1D6_PARCT|nr:high affinity copper uptake 1 isoform X1 [Paramuricea clavata]